MSNVRNRYTKAITEILRNHPDTRDNDEMLYFKYLLPYVEGLTGPELIRKIVFHDGFPKFSTFIRLRQMIQKHNPELRPDPKTYAKRQGIAERIRSEISS